jgi:hypothetical protein
MYHDISKNVTMFKLCTCVYSKWCIPKKSHKNANCKQVFIWILVCHLPPHLCKKKSTSPPHLWGLDYIIPEPMKWSVSPLNFPKSVKIPPKVVLKNHNKSQKNYKMKNPIVLDSKWVDLHNEHIIRYALVHFFATMKKSIDLKL